MIRRWWSARSAVLLLALGELLLAGLAAAPGSATLAAGASRQTVVATLASGDWVSLLAEIPGSTVAPNAGATPWVAAIAESLLAAVVALTLHAALYTFVSGAALDRMAGCSASLWSAGARWFWPMARLGAVVVLGILLLAGLAAVLLVLVPAGSIRATTPLVGWALSLGVLGGYFELARACLVLDATSARRPVRRALGQALSLVRRRPAPVLGVWLALGLGNLALAALVLGLTLVTSAANPALAWLVTLATTATGAGYKLFRLAAQVELRVERRPPPSAHGAGDAGSSPTAASSP